MAHTVHRAAPRAVVGNQARLRAAGRAILRRAPDTGALGKLPDADRKNLKFDTDAVTTDPKSYFGLKGEIVLATNVHEDFDIQAPMIDALKDDKVKSGL